MNKKILPLARVLGDLKIHINGENNISFKLGHSYTNYISMCFVGTYGNVVRRVDDYGARTALEELGALLKSLKVSLYEDDERFGKYLTEDVRHWLSYTIYELISGEFADPNVYKVKAKYEVDNTVIAVVDVEILTNSYTMELYNKIKEIAYLGEIVNFQRGNLGEFTVVSTLNDGTPEMSIPLGGRINKYHQFDFSSNILQTAKYIYRLNTFDYLLTRYKHDFTPCEETLAVTI